MFQTSDLLAVEHVDELRNSFKNYRKRLQLVIERKRHHIGYLMIIIMDI